jgi:glycine dehydrogenase
MDISNASLLDEGTSAAEAMNVAYDQLRGKRNKFFASSKCHPQTLGVLRTRAELCGIELVVGDVEKDMGDADQYFGVIVQYPDTEGNVNDWHDFAAYMKDNKVVVVAATDLLALTVLKPPGEWGADIAVGSAQRFGVPMFYGGPHAGFFACSDKFKRKMPGRLVGISRDAQGSPAYRLALQTREQHIRRDKATSNICTAQALLANTAASYAMYHGPKGLKNIAQRVTNMATCLRLGLNEIEGITCNEGAIFDTVTVDCGSHGSEQFLQKAVDHGMNLRSLQDGTRIGISLDETKTGADVEALLNIFGHPSPDMNAIASKAEELSEYNDNLARESSYLLHPVFNTYHSETSMMRYLVNLAAKDVSLTTSMISLGSCTMKLNAASEMEPVSW